MADDLGVALRQWRLQARLSQRDLALRIGFHESAVSSIERGERAPSAHHVRFYESRRVRFPPATHRLDLTRKVRNLAEPKIGVRSASARSLTLKQPSHESSRTCHVAVPGAVTGRVR